MLVLSRKPGEQILIDGNIVVTVLRCEGNKVRIGIKAPLGVPVMRTEVLERPTTLELPQDPPKA